MALSPLSVTNETDMMSGRVTLSRAALTLLHLRATKRWTCRRPSYWRLSPTCLTGPDANADSPTKNGVGHA